MLPVRSCVVVVVFEERIHVQVVVDILGLARIVSPQNAVILILGISFIGILFSGQFVIPEIFSALMGNAPHSALGPSTCSYGLIFFVIISIVSIVRYGILF